MRESHTPDAKVTGPPQTVAHDGGRGSGETHPTGIPDLLARLNAAGVAVWREGLLLIYTGRWAFRWQDKHATFECSNTEARNAITVAAQEVVHEAGAFVVPPTRWVEAACRVKEAQRA